MPAPFTNSHNPYHGSNGFEVDVPYGQGVPSEYELDHTDYRAIGTRCPLILVGWGYDLQGRPYPSDKHTLSELNNSTNYATVAFKGSKGYPSGGSVPSSGFIAAPLEVKYDHRTGLFKSDPSFLIKITGSRTLEQAELENLPENSPHIFYGWEEALQNKQGADAAQPGQIFTPNNPAKGTDSGNFAINIAEINQLAATPIINDTFVEAKAVRILNSNKLVYVFDRSPAPAVFPVRVKKVGGSAGDIDEQCSFIYDVYNIADTTGTTAILQGVSPILRRTEFGQYSEPPDYTIGLAITDGDGELRLYDANEVESVIDC